MGLSLDAGGHLTHGAKAALSGKWYNAVQYGVRREDHLIDFDQVEALAREHRPKLIITGGSAIFRSYLEAAFFFRARLATATLTARLTFAFLTAFLITAFLITAFLTALFAFARFLASLTAANRAAGLADGALDSEANGSIHPEPDQPISIE